MEAIIKTPNLPRKRVMHCLIGEVYTEEINELTALGINCIPLKASKSLDDEVSSHADMLCFNCGNASVVISSGAIGEEALKKLGFSVCTVEGIQSPYPTDVALNCALIKKKLICNKALTAPEILEFARSNNIEILNTRQGYTKCNICVVSENAVITEDEGITSLLNFCQIDVLTISKGDVFLSDKHYGFLGGASAKLSEGEIYFSGNIEGHKDYHKIMEFLNKHHVKPIYNKSRRLTDFGGFVALTEEI